MMQTLTFYFDFISPYAYLAAEGIEALAARHSRSVIWKPILLAAVLSHNQQRGPAEIPDKRRYTIKNVLRLAEAQGSVVQCPPAHPFNPLLPLRICSLRPEAGLIHHLFRACWKDGRAIDSEAALKSLMDEDTLKAASGSDAKAILKQNTQEAIEAGVFGVPSVLCDDELFWGVDSFPHIEAFLAGEERIDQALVERWQALPASANRPQVVAKTS